MGIDIAELIRTGNVVQKSEPTFSEWIVKSVENALENDHSYSETYWLTLEGMRPDISDSLSGTEFDPFYAMPDEFSLVKFCGKVYKSW